jgi:phosphomannomutase
MQVSSRMLGAMAAMEGFHWEQTLTGFKWLGNRALQLEAQGLTVLFAFEEAIGTRYAPKSPASPFTDTVL